MIDHQTAQTLEFEHHVHDSWRTGLQRPRRYQTRWLHHSPEYRNLQIPPEMQHELRTHRRLGQEKPQHHTKDPRIVRIVAGPRTICVGSKVSFLRIRRAIIYLWTITRPVIIRTTLETDLRT